MNSTPAHRTGVALMALLGLLGVVGLAGLGQEVAPPAGMVVLGAVLGAVTLVAALPAYNRTAGGIWTMIGAQAVSVATGIPVFWADNATTWVVVAVLVSWVVTAVAVVLLLPALRDQRVAEAVGSSRR